jgi:hypothetical protein
MSKKKATVEMDGWMGRTGVSDKGMTPSKFSLPFVQHCVSFPTHDLPRIKNPST